MNRTWLSAVALLVAVSTLPAVAQVAILPVVITTVGELPATPVDGRPYIVVDGLTASDCDRVSGGGGSHVHWCLYDTDAASYSAVAGAADTTCLDAGVTCLFAGSASEGGPATSALDLSCTGCVSAVEVAADVATQAELDAVAVAETDDQVAAEVPITDAGAFFTGIEVEAALQEIGPTMTDARTPTTHNHDAAEVVSGLLAAARIATGTPDGTKFLRDDQAWAAPAGGGSSAGTGLQVGDGAGGFTEVTGSASTAGGSISIAEGQSIGIGPLDASHASITTRPGSPSQLYFQLGDGSNTTSAWIGRVYFGSPALYKVYIQGDGTGRVGLAFDTPIGWSSAGSGDGGLDVGLARDSAGVVRVSDGGAGIGDLKLRQLIGVAQATPPVTCTAGTLGQSYADTSGGDCFCNGVSWANRGAVGDCS